MSPRIDAERRLAQALNSIDNFCQMREPVPGGPNRLSAHADEVERQLSRTHILVLRTLKMLVQFSAGQVAVTDACRMFRRYSVPAPWGGEISLLAMQFALG
jgi:hypothetical protein